MPVDDDGQVVEFRGPILGDGPHRLVVLCGCHRSVLVRVRGVIDGVEEWLVDHVIDGEWVGEWTDHTGEAMRDVLNGERWASMKGGGRRPSFDGWSASCRNTRCRRKVRGRTPDLVEFVRAAIESGERRVVLTSDTLAAARPNLGRRS